MAKKDNTASLIAALGDADRFRRESAAAELYREGCESARPVVDHWLSDAELEQCIIFGASRAAELTVGVAVQPMKFERIRSVHGSPQLSDVPPDQDAKEFDLHFSGGARLDVLTTREPGGTGAIARYLEKYGEGIQQIEISVRDVDCATAILASRFALAPIYPATRAGADGTRVNFFLAATPEGKKVLVELVEPKSEAKH